VGSHKPINRRLSMDIFDLSKTQNLMIVVPHEYKGLRVTAYPRCALLMGSKMIHGPLDQIRWRSTWTESGRWLVSTIPMDFEEVLMWDHLDWLPYQISFPTICGSSKTESGRVLGDQFKTDWSWKPKQTRNHVGPGLWLLLDVLAGHHRLNHFL
jgi:hypothetical protein